MEQTCKIDKTKILIFLKGKPITEYKFYDENTNRRLIHIPTVEQFLLPSKIKQVKLQIELSNALATRYN